MSKYLLISPETGCAAMEALHPVDHGWAWFVMLACFGVHITICTLVVSLGSLLHDFQERFVCSTWALTAVHGTALGLLMGLAPIGTALANRFTTRKVVFSAGVIGTLGYIGGSLAPNVQCFFLFQGLLVGIAHGLSLAPSLVIVTHYFKNRRGLAVAVGQSGFGIGSMVMPILIRYFVDEYGLTGAMLIQGGIIANVCVCAMLMRSPSIYIRRYRENTALKINNDYTNCLEIEVENPRAQSVEHFTLSVSVSSNEAVLRGNLDRCSLTSADNSIKYDTKDISNCSKESVLNSTAAEQARLAELNSIEHKPSNTRVAQIVRHINQYFNVSLLTNPLMWIYICGGVASEIFWCSAIITLPSVAIGRNVSASHVVAILGGATLLGRLIVGPFSDLQFVQRKYIYSLTVLLAGLVGSFSPYATERQLFIAICLFTGLFSAFNVTLLILVLSDVLGAKNISTSLGIVMFAQFIGVTGASQAVGILFDVTGDWDASLWLGAIACYCGGIITLLETPLRLRQKKPPLPTESI